MVTANRALDRGRCHDGAVTTHVRFAGPDDAATILHFITELAIYEREPDAVEATEDSLRDQLTGDRPPFECLIAEVDGEARGFALFFHNYSTWRGRAGIYLEDLFVPEEHRGTGLGRLLLATLVGLFTSFFQYRRPLSVLLGEIHKATPGSMVEQVALSSLRADDARRAGAPSVTALKDALAHRTDRPVYRVGLAFALDLVGPKRDLGSETAARRADTPA